MKNVRLSKRFWDTPVYSSGVQVPGTGIIRVNSNENPYKIPAEIIARSNENTTYNTYPDKMSRGLCEAIGLSYGIDADRILAGAGASGVLSTLFAALVDPDDVVVSMLPGFGMYEVLTRSVGAHYAPVKWSSGFLLDHEAISERGPRMVVFSNPNNPTATRISNKEIVRVASGTRAIIVVDEAYCDFSTGHDLNAFEDLDNVIVVRSFSKSFSAATLRVGYCVGERTLVSAIRDRQFPYQIPGHSQAIAVEIMRNRAAFDDNVARIIETRELTLSKMRSLGFQVQQSSTNFLLVDVPGKGNGAHWASALRTHGVLVRDLAQCPNSIRISIGLPEEMETVCERLEQVQASFASTEVWQ